MKPKNFFDNNSYLNNSCFNNNNESEYNDDECNLGGIERSEVFVNMQATIKKRRYAAVSAPNVAKLARTYDKS